MHVTSRKRIFGRIAKARVAALFIAATTVAFAENKCYVILSSQPSSGGCPTSPCTVLLTYDLQGESAIQTMCVTVEFQSECTDGVFSGSVKRYTAACVAAPAYPIPGWDGPPYTCPPTGSPYPGSSYQYQDETQRNDLKKATGNACDG